MNTQKIIEAVEKAILNRPLTAIERLILQESWSGQTYKEMAKTSSYGIPHMKEVGSHLWQELSDVLGQRVTKKTLHLVLSSAQTDPSTSTVNNPILSSSVASQDRIPVKSLNFTFPGAPLPINSPCYIARPPIEERVIKEISKSGCAIRIKAPRKTGKSSLLNWVIDQAINLGYKIVYIDGQEADKSIFTSLDKLLRWFCNNVRYQLGLNTNLEDYWHEEIGSKVSCKFYFQEGILQNLNSPLVLIFNEMQPIFEHPKIAQDFLPMLRFWYEQAQGMEIWKKLRLVMVYTTEMDVPLPFHQSPFNVGLAIALPPFNLAQLQALAQYYQLDWATEETGMQPLIQLLEMLGGHPYLSNLAFYHLRQHPMSLQQFLQEAPTPSGIYGSYLYEYLALVRKDPRLVSALQKVVNSPESVTLDATTAYKLESMGLIRLRGHQALPSCKLYQLYFQEQLKTETLSFVWRSPWSHFREDTSPNYDLLTQLFNRAYFYELIEINWQQWEQKQIPLAAIFCDIDCFKFYNDAFGHTAGDQALRQIANVLQNSIGTTSALIARYAGSKFAVLLFPGDRTLATTLAETFRHHVQALGISHELSNMAGFPDTVLTVSIGIAVTTASIETSPNLLITSAEAALAQAKRQGGNCLFVSAV